MDYFFYGTLLDRDLLACVVGRRVPDARIESAKLEGYRRLRMTGTPYPMLAHESGGRVDGILVKGLGRTAAGRLADYEGNRYTVQVLPVIGSRSGLARASGSIVTLGPRASRESNHGIHESRGASAETDGHHPFRPHHQAGNHALARALELQALG